MAEDLHPLAKEFAGKRSLYGDFGEALCVLVRKLSELEGIQIQTVTTRAKDVSSLSAKAHSATEPYGRLEDITDLAGVRLITYFSGDIDKLATAIEREFTIDRANSVDKRMAASPDQFGYASLHYVLSLSDNRTSLAEYRRFSGLKAELQVRSLLQHTWAEIEHDLGYKSKNAVPVSVQRRFARLAGLLELADEEFCSIRLALDDYQESVEKQISAGTTTATIDRLSLAAFIQTNDIVQRLDYRIALIFGTARMSDPDAANLGHHVERLAHFGIRELSTLNALLRENETKLVAFASEWLREHEEHDVITRGISLFYLAYLLAAQSNDPEQVADYLRTSRIGIDEFEPFIEKVLHTARVATASGQQAPQAQ